MCLLPGLEPTSLQVMSQGHGFEDVRFIGLKSLLASGWTVCEYKPHIHDARTAKPRSILVSDFHLIIPRILDGSYQLNTTHVTEILVVGSKIVFNFLTAHAWCEYLLIGPEYSLIKDFTFLLCPLLDKISSARQ